MLNPATAADPHPRKNPTGPMKRHRWQHTNCLAGTLYQHLSNSNENLAVATDQSGAVNHDERATRLQVKANQRHSSNNRTDSSAGSDSLQTETKNATFNALW